jgi:hypothetical protein
LHKRTSPVVSSSFGFPASNWEALVAYRLHAGSRELKPDNQTNPRLHAPLETSRAHCWACQYEEATTSAVNREAIANAVRSLPFAAFLRIRHIQYIGRTSGKLQRCLETRPN